LKKILSIFLLGTFLFNIIGYKVFFYFIQQNAEYRIQAKIDTIKDDDKGLSIVRVPLNLPYQTNWAEFERIDGEVSFNGITYKYVKRKVFNDTLVLVCLPFKEKTVIQKNSNDYFKKVNDLANDTNKKPPAKQGKMDDYYQPTSINKSVICQFEISRIYQHYLRICAPGYLNSIFMPPDKTA